MFNSQIMRNMKVHIDDIFVKSRKMDDPDLDEAFRF